ncbi:MAG: outer membrane lipid asymmetry maintenance protein MlaD [Bdellovibrionales bacterium]|nr:outer membrane lipid asymmetry maintenance protein MlaD [Bdellovibrionales bacterium]
MGQSESSSATKAPVLERPPRNFNMEFWVGLFSLFSFACLAYLAVGLGDISLFESGKYEVNAEFDNIAGLKNGASVEIAGVKVGDVTSIRLNQERATAVVTLKINEGITLHEDDIVSIRTKGIIGDRYVKISSGASDEAVKPGGMIMETESVVDIEDIIGKVLHSFGGDDDEESN